MVLLAVVVAVVVAVSAVLAIVIPDGSDPAADDPPAGGESETTDDPDPTEDEPEEPEFRDWLVPTSTIKVDKLRYVSPCQALNLDDAREIFGDLSAGSGVTEETYDSSIVYPPDSLSTAVEVTCDYDEVVSLTAEQYPTVQDLTFSGIGSASITGGDVQETVPVLRRYRRAAALTDDAELRAFINDVIAAGRANIRYERDSDRRAFRGLRFRDVVVPVGPEPLQLRFFYRNTVLTLGPSATEFLEIGTLSDEEVLDELEKLKAGIERVRERVADPRLSQSFAPTILGETDRFGDTFLLEPCAVLTRGVFRTITGRKPNEIVRRYTLPVSDFDAPSTAATRASEISISNSCERNHQTEYADFSNDDISVRLDIRYARTAQELKEGMRAEDYLPLKRKDSRLRTAADFAAEYPIPGFDGSTFRFTVDNYLVEVSIDRLSSDGFFGEITQGQDGRANHVRAINELVPALKRHLAAVEKASPTG